MTDEEIRIKVAESLGAKWHSVLTTPKIERLVLAFRQWTDLGANRWDLPDGRVLSHDVPNYPEDLNACAEFEAALTDEERRSYFFHLFGTQRLEDGDLWKAVSATARQRCQAYLKTKGLLP